MEYLMGLTSSPYIRWLQEAGDEPWVPALLAEVEDDVSAVWQFLIDREIEAPERYSAIQSYRAAMAILRQQRHFVEVCVVVVWVCGVWGVCVGWGVGACAAAAAVVVVVVVGRGVCVYTHAAAPSHPATRPPNKRTQTPPNHHKRRSRTSL